MKPSKGQLNWAGKKGVVDQWYSLNGMRDKGDRRHHC